MTDEAPQPLRIDGLGVTYGRRTALHSLDLTVDAGSVVGLVGPNGCGKTTTLRTIMGLVPPTHGSVRVCGLPAQARDARREVAWVPDEPTGLDELTVGEFLDLVGALYRADDAFARRCSALARAFRLDGRLDSALRSLSHGMRRSASIVAAAALARPVLLVDEATAALDPEAAVVLREVLAALSGRGTAVLVATQDLHFAERSCDRVVLLHDGVVAAEGTVPALRLRYETDSLEGVFLAATGVAERVERVRDGLAAL